MVIQRDYARMRTTQEQFHVLLMPAVILLLLVVVVVDGRRIIDYVTVTVT